MSREASTARPSNQSSHYFTRYLTEEAIGVYNAVRQYVSFEEDSEPCQKQEIYGWYDFEKGMVTICTARIKSGPEWQYYINETLLHEAAHVAQSCKGSFREYKAFSLPVKKAELSERRLEDIESAVALNGESHRTIETEAFWLEDKPNEVKYVVEKFCGRRDTEA